jgi:hypothetical protein
MIKYNVGSNSPLMLLKNSGPTENVPHPYFFVQTENTIKKEESST